LTVRTQPPIEEAVMPRVRHINQSSRNEKALVANRHLDAQFAAHCLDILAKSVELSALDVPMLNPRDSVLTDI
jgi:hypothetical protein